MSSEHLLATAAAFVAALFVGSLVEYLVHRLMHRGKLLGKKHVLHHREGDAQGWLGEFKDYFVGSLPLILGGWLIGYFLIGSTGAAWGWTAGAILYACIAAYAHQVQHERPELVFWLPRPVHHLHHKHKMWHHNFGITLDLWDRVFRTYKQVPWTPERRPFQHPLRNFVQIKWY